MDTLKISKTKIFCYGLIVAIITTFGSLLFQRHSDNSRVFLHTNFYGYGYPFAYYSPGGDDYGSSFYFKPYFADLAICFSFIFLAIFILKIISVKFLKNNKE